MTGYARATTVIAGAVVALALTGCSDDAGTEPGTTPSASTSATASPSSSTTSSTTTAPGSTASVSVPAAARAHTEDGAKAFAEFYYEVLSDSQYRADASQLRALSADECVACEAFAKKADKMRERGQHVDSRSLVVKQSQVTPAKPSAGFVIDVLAEDQPSRVVSKDGSVVSSSEGSKLAFRTTVVWQGSGWQVSDSKLVKG